MMIYLNGQFVPSKEAKVSVLDHGFLYGDGVFEGIRAYDGVVFRLREHLVRLYQSAKVIDVQIPISIDEMEKATLEVLRLNNLHTAYIRMVVSRGYGDMGLDPRKCKEATVAIIPASVSLYPKVMYEQGLEVAIVSTRKSRADMLSPRVKSLNYLNNIMAKMEINRQGLPEGIMLNTEGQVTEATADNIFIVKDGLLITPPRYLGILEGITRNAVMDIAHENDIDCIEEPFTAYDLYNADECFLTGTAAEIIAVVKVDGRIIGNGTPGKMTGNILALFKERTEWDGTRIID